MAKQTGPNPFTGRRGNLLGYRMGGQYYARIISSLTAERVLSDPAFKQTMQQAGLLGKASKIASGIYRLLREREHGFYRKLTGMAMQLLKQGRAAEEVFEQLYRDFIQPAPEVLPNDRVSNPLLSGATLDTEGEFPQRKYVSDRQLRFIFRSEPIDIPGRRRISDSLFPDELLRLLFPESPKAREMETASLADHSPA